MAAIAGEQDRLMATAQQIVKSLNASKDARENMISILSSFDNRLSKITDVMANARFEAAEKLILQCDSTSGSSESSRRGSPPPWEDSPDEAAEYLSAVDEILLSIDGLDGEVADRAEVAIQIAMSRLEDEFRHVLIRNTVPLDADGVYGSSIRADSISFSSSHVEIGEDFESFAENDRQGDFCVWRGSNLGDDRDVSVDLIHPDALIELKEIADRMIRAGYEKECCQVYCNVRRDVIDECMSIIGVEKLSIEEVQRIEWKSLDEKMKTWIKAIKIVVRVLLSGEKQLCEQIFDGADLIKEVCFVETTKGCVMQLLNFGEAVAIGRRSSEKLFRILDMYDVLVGVFPDLQALFSDESGELVCSEARGVLAALGEAGIGTLVEFENAVQNETSRKAIQGGEIHPLTRYVMNYMKLLVDYSDSLNSLLENNGDDSESSQTDNLDNLKLEDMSLVARRLLLLITSLESNIEEKSRLYEDTAMQYIFLMNNILYIVQKVKDSELGKLLGDHWVRKRNGRVRQYATQYLRATWTKALSCLKDEGISGSTSNASKMALKERFKNFNVCFEDIYRIQTAWKVPDAQLREELRISISEKVLPAYRAFVGRFGSQLESGRHAGKYIKYTPDDLENYLLDLFEGTPSMLHLTRRKSA